MKNILITGGLGYLGGRIAQHLLNTNKYQITLCSRSLTQNSIPQELIDAKVVLLDILNYSQCLKATEGIDCVIHLAALNEIDSAANPELAALVNTQGTKNLLDAAIANKTNRFVYFSTAHIYGTPLQGIITEETLAKPVHPYAITHKNSEDYIRDAHKQCKIQGISLRLSNAIGSPLTKNINRWTLIANDLCKQAVETGKLTLKTPGTQL
ncbi:MAG: SDR family oxidoreductase, partial [Endomicrobiales bacterium]|nr:SDR family oxidoreductase [Endomicrobiales bacterium]